MKRSRLFIFIFAFLLLTTSVQAAMPPAQMKKQMLTHLDFVRSVFESKYAPLEWKQKHLQWNLQAEYEKAKKQVEALKTPTVKDYHRILKAFFLSAKDFHAAALFHSTEQSLLPFLVKSAQGKYYICYVDRRMLPMCDLDVGDEVISFGGKPIKSAVEEVKKKEMGSTLESDDAYAELLLTNRRGLFGDEVPHGPIVIEVRKKLTGQTRLYELQWIYMPELIQDVGKTGSSPKAHLSTFPFLSDKNQEQTVCFQQLMCHPFWENLITVQASGNPHAIGSRKSFLPIFGEKIWAHEGESAFDAYLFTLPTHQVVGYVRIPHYMAGEKEMETFRELIRFFENHTEALVIDQINNHGGLLLYAYGLLSLLTDRPLETPKHRLMITQADVMTAYEILSELYNVKTEAHAREYLGETFNGYPINLSFVEKMREYAEHIISEWNLGHLYTDKVHILGVDKIFPHPSGVRYTKPVIVLVNSLCYSSADFLPAILQDNKRATIFGQRTAGAGGFIQSITTPNQLGVVKFTITGSFAERLNSQPIENLGVTPDIKYSYSERDLKENYRDYRAAVMQSLTELLAAKRN